MTTATTTVPSPATTPRQPTGDRNRSDDLARISAASEALQRASKAYAQAQRELADAADTLGDLDHRHDLNIGTVGGLIEETCGYQVDIGEAIGRCIAARDELQAEV